MILVSSVVSLETLVFRNDYYYVLSGTLHHANSIIVSYWATLISILVKRLARKSISEMTCFVSSGM